MKVAKYLRIITKHERITKQRKEPNKLLENKDINELLENKEMNKLLENKDTYKLYPRIIDVINTKPGGERTLYFIPDHKRCKNKSAKLFNERRTTKHAP